MWLSLGKEKVGGEWENKNPRQVAVDMRRATMQHMVDRGEFFRIGSGSYYLDKAASCLIPVSLTSPALRKLLWRLGYVPKSGFTAAILESIVDHAAMARVRPYHRVAYLSEEALYIRASDNTMLRIKADEIREVPLGTDDVILIANDLASWPPLKELKPLIEEMSATIGKTCTQIRPDLPLSHHLTTRWSTDSPLSPDQAHQLFITRLMFIFAASRYSLWPIILLIGDQGSGKSTPLELLLVLLRDDIAATTKSLPGKEDGLIAALTNSAVCCFDNVDGARLDDPQRSTISDIICHLSTGAEVPWRKLFSDMEVLNFKIQNHALFTARVDPFSSRIDVHRRTITLTMEPPEIPSEVMEEKPTKELYRAWTYTARPRILAEILLRCQNMVRAHQQYGTKQYRSRTEMADYEVFTYRCAEYEGTLPETQALWEVSRKLYLEAITDHNFLVLALRTWLGRTGVPNPNREVSPQTLFGELESMFSETKNFPYRNPAQFGKHIGTNLPALRVLGFAKVTTRSGHSYVFRPSESELERCHQTYKDFHAVNMLRLTSMLRPNGGDRYMDISDDNPKPYCN